MDGFVVKSFSQLRYPEIVHLDLKHKFRVNLNSEGLRLVPNTHKHDYWSEGLERMHLVENDFRNFGTPK
jgi:hypothetical protein